MMIDGIVQAIMNPVAELLAKAENELLQAKQFVMELQLQVDALRVAKNSYDQHMVGRPSVTPLIPPIILPPLPQREFGKPLPHVATRNTKGMVTPTILEVLADGKPRSVEQILSEVNERLTVPTSRASLRSTLGNLKERGFIASSSYGMYQGGSQKGETPSNTSGNS